MAICSVPTVKPKHGRLIYIGFILFGVLLSMLTFLPGFRRFFVVHSHFCSRNTSQGKCDALVGHILLYRFYIGMMVFFLILALVNCQLAAFTTLSPWLENGLWFVKFHLFCLSILVAFFIPEGHLSNAVMHTGWIGSFIIMIIQLVLIIDLAKYLNTCWVEKMELSTNPNRLYISLLLLTSLLYTLSVSFVVYFYAIFTTSLQDCKTNLVFFTVIVLLCLTASLLSIHPKVRETGLLQAGIVTSYSIYLAWTCMQHYPYSMCNPSWKVLFATEFNFHIQLNMIIDLCTTFLVLVYGVMRVPSVEHLFTTVNLTNFHIFRAQSDNQEGAENGNQPFLISAYLMYYLFLILICLHFLMIVSNFYTPEGIVGTEDEVVVSEYKLIDMDEYVKTLSQWVASCLKMILCVVFLLMYIWTILAPVIFSYMQNDSM